jgi:hypothetical protein
VSDKKQIGLKAVSSARVERDRSKHGKVTGPVWLAAGGAVVLTLVLSWALSDRSLSNARDELLAQQRAAVATVGKEWYPLRDKLEKVTLEAAGAYKGDQVAPEARTWDFRGQPGLYLRLRTVDAKDTKSLRERARESVRDGFTTCLLRDVNAGAKADADAGWGPDQPWNLRQAYASTRVLSDEWVSDVREASDNLRLRVFEQQYAKAKREEIPLAIEIVKRAQFFLLVLDEDVPEAKEYADDAGLITEEALQQVGHPARVHVFDVKTGEELVRLRKTSEAGFVFTGDRAVGDPEVRAAMRRQVNNCALAQDVWSSIRPAAEKATPGASDAGAVDAAADAK